MLFVGATTAFGLWLLDVPLALSVGVLSGLLAFIPFFGAIAGGLLAVLLGFMRGPETALYVLILAAVIQQVEGNVLMPLVERWAVGLPPVLGLAATVMFGVLFGLLGVLLAAPAMIVLMVVDHAREYSAGTGGVSDPMALDRVTPLLFWMRWAAHFCAPVFTLLAGVSAGAEGRRAEAGSFHSIFRIRRELAAPEERALQLSTTSQ
jgi:hypothetical protein